jgi:hypothetical protein
MGETGFLRYFLYTQILVGKEANGLGHSELVDIIADADAGKLFQFIVKRSTAHGHLCSDKLHIHVGIGQVADNQVVQLVYKLFVCIADRIGFRRNDLSGFLITVSSCAAV